MLHGVLRVAQYPFVCVRAACVRACVRARERVSRRLGGPMPLIWRFGDLIARSNDDGATSKVIAVTLLGLTIAGIWNFMLQIKFMVYIKFTDESILHSKNITEYIAGQSLGDNAWISDGAFVCCSFVCLAMPVQVDGGPASCHAGAG